MKYALLYVLSSCPKCHKSAKPISTHFFRICSPTSSFSIHKYCNICKKTKEKKNPNILTKIEVINICKNLHFNIRYAKSTHNNHNQNLKTKPQKKTKIIIRGQKIANLCLHFSRVSIVGWYSTFSIHPSIFKNTIPITYKRTYFFMWTFLIYKQIFTHFTQFSTNKTNDNNKNVLQMNITRAQNQ